MNIGDAFSRKRASQFLETKVVTLPNRFCATTLTFMMKAISRPFYGARTKRPCTRLASKPTAFQPYRPVMNLRSLTKDARDHTRYMGALRAYHSHTSAPSSETSSGSDFTPSHTHRKNSHHSTYTTSHTSTPFSVVGFSSKGNLYLAIAFDSPSHNSHVHLHLTF